MNHRRDNGAAWRIPAMTATCMVAGLVVTAQPARAGDWSVHLGVGDRSGGYIQGWYGDRSCDVSAGRVWVEPTYVDRGVRVRVPAVVRTREVPIYDRWGDVVSYRTVEEIVEPAYYTYRRERVLVSDGYYRTTRPPAYRRTIQRRRGSPVLRVGFERRSHRVRGHHRGHGHRRGLRVGFGRRH